MGAATRFNPAKALTSGKPVLEISSAQKYGFTEKETHRAFFSNPSSMKQKIVDAYYPSSKPKDTPLTLYKFDRTTHSIKKIKIIDI